MKNLIKKFNTFGKMQSFQPNILSIVLNPVFVHRYFLFSFIKTKAPLLTGKLLDFGCGRKPYKNLFSKVDSYIGVDIEVSGHAHQESEIDFFYDGKKIPFENDYFDSLFCGEVIEHLFEPELILKELNRVLKPNGIGILTFPFAWQEHEIPYDYARYTSYGTKYLLEKYGFEIVEYQKSGHFLLVVWQLLSNYIFNLFMTKNRYMNTLFSCIILTPFNIIAIILACLPISKSLYLSNMVVIKKKII